MPLYLYHVLFRQMLTSTWRGRVPASQRSWGGSPPWWKRTPSSVWVSDFYVHSYVHLNEGLHRRRKFISWKKYLSYKRLEDALVLRRYNITYNYLNCHEKWLISATSAKNFVVKHLYYDYMMLYYKCQLCQLENFEGLKSMAQGSSIWNSKESQCFTWQKSSDVH